MVMKLCICSQSNGALERQMCNMLHLIEHVQPPACSMLTTVVQCDCRSNSGYLQILPVLAHLLQP